MIKLKIFTASPGDVNEEREILSSVVIPELSRIFGIHQLFSKDNQIELESIRWETHTWPDIGEDAQDVINKQLSVFDIFVGIMWKRFGTPTKRSGSGTGEEFERAYQLHKKFGKPKIMFYFRNEAFYPQSREELSQFDKVLEFKQKIERLGVRYWSYEKPVDFERFVREHLIRQIFDNLKMFSENESIKKKSIETHELIKPNIKAFISYAREDREKAINLYEDLKNLGLDVWLDIENLLPGMNWKREIEKAISESQYFLALLSSHTVSKIGYVQKELKIAMEILDVLPERQIFLLPIRLDDCSPNHEKLLNLHWVDMFPDWKKGLNNIMKVMKQSR